MDLGTNRIFQRSLGTRRERRPKPSKFKPLEDRYVRVGDVRTRYRAAGEAGHPLILIHGLGASLEAWMYNLQPLARHHRVFALDLVWFGKSDKPARQVTGEYFADFIIGFMDAVGIRQATLVGNSMGGMIAVKTALQYPDRVTGLVLANSAGFGQELAWWLRLRTLFSFPELVRPPLSVARYAARHLVYDPRTLTDDLIQAVLDLEVQPGSLEAARRVLKYGVNWRGLRPDALHEIRDAARALRVPTLIVWGKQDRVIPVAHAEIARRHIPDAQLHVFDQCGHAPMIEKADQFNELVARFVREKVIQSGRRLAA